MTFWRSVLAIVVALWIAAGVPAGVIWWVRDSREQKQLQRDFKDMEKESRRDAEKEKLKAQKRAESEVPVSGIPSEK